MENIQEIIDTVIKDYDKDWVIKTVLSKTIRSRSPSDDTDIQSISWQAEREFVNKTEIRSNYAFRRGTYGQMSYIVKEKIQQSIVAHICILVNELVEEGMLDEKIYDYDGSIGISLSEKYFANEVKDFNLDETTILLRQLIQEVAVSKKRIDRTISLLKSRFDEDFIIKLIEKRVIKTDSIESRINVFELEMSISYNIEKEFEHKFKGNISNREIARAHDEIKDHLQNILSDLAEKEKITLTMSDGGYWVKLSDVYIESEISNFSLD